MNFNSEIKYMHIKEEVISSHCMYEMHLHKMCIFFFSFFFLNNVFLNKLIDMDKKKKKKKMSVLLLTQMYLDQS